MATDDDTRIDDAIQSPEELIEYQNQRLKRRSVSELVQARAVAGGKRQRIRFRTVAPSGW